MELPAVYNKLTRKERRAVRERYVILQDGKCYFCKAPLDGDPPEEITSKDITWRLFPPNFLKYPVHLQHDHEFGKTEGAVHAFCNAYWWEYHGR